MGLVLVGGCAALGKRVEASPDRRAALALSAAVGPRAGSGLTATGLASVGDPASDQGRGPRYADLREVSFEESGGDLSAVVSLGAAVPRRLARREMEEVGVELYRHNRFVAGLSKLLGSETSDYQLLLDGSHQGWRAFLHTRDGFVRLPGTFTMRGRTLRVTLPWDSIGGRGYGSVSAYAEWSSGVGRLTTDGTSRVELLPR